MDQEIFHGAWIEDGIVTGIYDSAIYINNPKSPLSSKTIAKSSVKSLIQPDRRFVPDKISYPISCSLGIGGDPEIFVIDKNRQVIPAFEFLPKPQTLAARVPMEIHNDGFQAEFSFTGGPHGCLAHMVDDYHAGLKGILTQARKQFPDANLVSRSVVDIPEEYLMAASENFVRLGCEPSMNIYGDHGKVIVDGRALPIRFAGSHMHFGDALRIHPTLVEPITKALDTIVGVGSIALFGHRENRDRRRYYGQAGEYRLPKHGYEYRVVSSRMLHHPVFVHLLFDVGRIAYSLGKFRLFEFFSKNDIKSVRQVINSNDRQGAIELIKENDELWRGILGRKFQFSTVEGIIEVLLGKKKIVSNGISANWKFDGSWIGHSESLNCCVCNMLTEKC